MLCAVSGAVFWKRNSHTVEMSGAPDQTRKMKTSRMLPCSVSVSPSTGSAMYRHLVPPKCTSAVTNNVWLWPRLCWNFEMLLHISNALWSKTFWTENVFQSRFDASLTCNRKKDTTPHASNTQCDLLAKCRTNSHGFFIQSYLRPVGCAVSVTGVPFSVTGQWILKTMMLVRIFPFFISCRHIVHKKSVSSLNLLLVCFTSI